MAKPLLPQRTRLSKGMRKELFRNAYEIQHDISLVFASIVLLAWEGKNECPSHMTLLYQQKLCRNNYADEDFGGLAFIIQRNPTDSRKTPPGSWAVSRADIQKTVSMCPHQHPPTISSHFVLQAIPESALPILMLLILHGHPSFFISSFWHRTYFFPTNFFLIFNYTFTKLPTVAGDAHCNST